METPLEYENPYLDQPKGRYTFIALSLFMFFGMPTIIWCVTKALM